MKKIGRAFNHLEDLVLFHGSDGVNEAIHHINEIIQDSSHVRMKWDGNLQIYWGREHLNGPLIMANHNAWLRNKKLDSKNDNQKEKVLKLMLCSQVSLK